MASISNWNKNWENEKYNSGETIWVNDQTHQHIHHCGTTYSPSSKYEDLPNFVGGLYVDRGTLMLKKKDDTRVMIGKVGDISTAENLIYSIIDEFFSD